MGNGGFFLVCFQENTSGWYIHTVAQLKAIQESCKSLSGTYWSS